jgi:microcin C transport system substrate-binding protein
MIHSSTAFDEKGNPKPHTNNLNSWARPDTDRLCIEHRNARTVEEMRKAHRELQWIIHNEALFNPAYSVDFIRIGSWRWIRWPDSETTRFSPPLLYDPHESFVFWVDEEMKQETLAARRSGATFPEVKKVVDDYRLRPNPTEQADESEPPAAPAAPAAESNNPENAEP